MQKASVDLKLRVLSQGVSFGDGFLDAYESRLDLIEKRRAYGTGDAVLDVRARRAPQEILLPGDIICAANYNPDSPWRLIHADGEFQLSDGAVVHRVSFPRRPLCYGEKLSNGDVVERVVTAYGDSTLGIFSPGHCYYFNTGRECRFCSLGAARDGSDLHRMGIRGDLALEAVRMACELEPDRYRRVLLNGGTISDYDKGMLLHLEVLQGVSAVCEAKGLRSSLISMPPMDFALLKRLPTVCDSLAMSLEVFDPRLFEETCPGKAQDYGRDRFLEAFAEAVEVLGHGNVYAGFVAGLEPLDSLLEGMEYFSRMGVVPAVAVFHPDAGSHFSRRPRPDAAFLRKVGLAMSDIYEHNGFVPFIEGSGRNSLDTEAYLRGF